MNYEFAERVAQAAFAQALAFFQPSPEWRPELRRDVIDDAEICAQCWTKPNYFIAHIVYDPDNCENGAELWRVIGHEVAHLLSPEYTVLEGMLPERYHAYSNHANEVLTTRLERLFLRHHPYPGDEQFAEAV